MIPLVDAKLILPEGAVFQLKFIRQSVDRYFFEIKNIRQFFSLKDIFKANTQFSFVSLLNNKIYKWKGTIKNIHEKERILNISDVIIFDIQDDPRKERLEVKDKVFIKELYYQDRYLNLDGKIIPAFTKDISETGVLLYTSLDLSEVEKDINNEIVIIFEGTILKELGTKVVNLKRIFFNNNVYYYGCQFKIKHFDEVKQINKTIQAIKTKNL